MNDALFIMVTSGGLLVTVCGLRFMMTLLGRLFGFYSPDHYAVWQRLPWRPFFYLWTCLRQWYEQQFLMGKRGHTGGFASSLETLSLLYKPNKLHLGRATAFGIGLFQPVGLSIQRHGFVLAMNGAGKTTALATMIGLWRGSVVLIDPKAQIVNALSSHDKRQWFVFDPDGISHVQSVCINFFDCLKEAIQRDGESTAVLWAKRIAEALIVTPSGSKSPYFFDVSRQFLSGLILHVLTTHPETDHNLPLVRDLIVNGYKLYNEDSSEETQGDECHQLLLFTMSQNTAFDGAIIGAASAMQSARGETGGSVRSTLQEQTDFLDIPNVRAVLKHSDFSLSELKTRDDIVFAFTASIYSLREELSRLSRLLNNMLAYTFESVKEKKGQCLTIIDELPSMGYNPTFEVMLATARSMGQSLIGVAQNIELMKRHYPDSYKSFIGESDFTFWMGGNHPDNNQLLSQLIGKKTIVKHDPVTGQKSIQDIDVMSAEQIARFLNPNKDNLIVTRAGERPLKLKNDPYYKALTVWQYAAAPEHGDQFFRKITRFFLRR